MHSMFVRQITLSTLNKKASGFIVDGFVHVVFERSSSIGFSLRKTRQFYSKYSEKIRCQVLNYFG